MTTAVRWRFAAVAATAVLAVGCSAAQEEAPESEFDAYLAVIFGGNDPDRSNSTMTEIQELIATCMADAGFEYYPDPEDGAGGYAVPAEVGTVAFAEEFGYGITIETDPPNTPPMWVPDLEESGAARSNREHRESLTPEALEQYDRAYYGPPVDDVLVLSGEWVYDPAEAGCEGRAYETALPDGMAGPAELSEVKQAVREVWTQLHLDPRAVEAGLDWGSCMADAGYPGMSEPLDAENLIWTDVFSRWQDRWAYQVDPHLGVTDYEVVRTRAPEALAELRAGEIVIAVADATCREETGYAEAIALVENDMEQAVVDAYRADLEAWAEWAEQRRADE